MEKPVLSEAFLSEAERNCLNILRGSTDVLADLQSVDWVPRAPVDVRFWVETLFKIEDALEACLEAHPDILTSHRKGGFNLEPTETRIKRALQFVTSLLNWLDMSERYVSTGVYLKLIEARDADLALMALQVLAMGNDSRPLSWRHRIVGTRWFRDRHWKFQATSEKTAELFEKYATKVFAIGSESIVSPGDNRADQEDLGAVTIAFDEDVSTVVSFDYEKCGFIALMEKRAKLAPLWFGRFKLYAALFRGYGGLSKTVRSSVVRKASLILFSTPNAPLFDLMAACRILEASQSSVVRSILLSRVPGRGVLIESTRKMIGEADAEFETKIGLSFERAAGGDSSDKFWFGLEARVVLCTMLTAHEGSYGLLVDGGVFRSIVKWLKHALVEEDEELTDESALSGDNGADGRYIALTACCFFYINVILKHHDALESAADIADLVTGAEKLVVRMCQIQQPSFAQRNLLSGLISAIGSGYQVLRRQLLTVQDTALDIQAESSPIRNLIIMCVDNALKLGGSVIQAAGECLSEISRGNTRLELAFQKGLRNSILDLLGSISDRCPAEDQEGVYAIARHFYTILRKVGPPTRRGSPGALYEMINLNGLLSTMRNDRFNYAYSGSWNNLGQGLQHFCAESSDVAAHVAEEMTHAVKGLRDEGVSLKSWEQTIRCLISLCAVREFAKSFIENDGFDAVCRSLRDEDINQHTIQILNTFVVTIGGNARIDTVEALAAQICSALEDPTSCRSGPRYAWIVFLAEEFLELFVAGGSPMFSRRSSAEVMIGSDAVIRALAALEQWDGQCETPTRPYANFLARITASLPVRSQSSVGKRSRPAHEAGVILHLVRSVESLLSKDPERALVRLRSIFHSAPLAAFDDLLRMLYEHGNLEQIIQLACEGLSEPGMGRPGFDVITVLCESDVFRTAEFSEENHALAVARASYSLARMLLVHFDRINYDQVLDNVFSQFALGCVLKLMKHRTSWRPPNERLLKKEFEEQQAQKSKREQQQTPAFKPDRNVIHSLVDIGFHAALALQAQEHLRTNNLEELAYYLVEHPRDLTEEDELRVAVWMSEETTSEKENDDDAAAPEPEISEDERAENEKLDTEEKVAKQLAQSIVNKIKKRSKSIGTSRGVLNLPWEVCIADLARINVPSKNLHRKIPDELPPFGFTGDALLYVTNNTSSLLRIELGRILAASDPGLAYWTDKYVDVQPGEVKKPIHTFVDAPLTVSLVSDPKTIIGVIPALWCHLHVDIPHNALELRTQVGLVSPSEFPVTRSRPSWTYKSGEKDSELVDVIIVNPLSVAIVANPLRDIAGERTIIQPRDSAVKRVYRNESLFFHTLLTQHSLGFANIDRFRRPAHQKKDPAPSTFAVVVNSAVIPRIYSTMAVAMSGLINDPKEGGEYLLSISSNLILSSAMLRVGKKCAEWLEDIDVQLLLMQILEGLHSPHQGTSLIEPGPKTDSTHSKHVATAGGRKRMATEAGLLQEDTRMLVEVERGRHDDEEVNEPDGSKKKKQEPLLDRSLGPLQNDCECPRRAHGLKVLAYILSHLGQENDLKSRVISCLAGSLESLNAYETESMLLLLGLLDPSALSLRHVIASAYKYGVSDALRTTVARMLRTADDDVFAYRVRAANAFQQLSIASLSGSSGSVTKSPANPPKITMQALVKALALKTQQQAEFADATSNGFFRTDPESGNILGYETPAPNLEMGGALAQEFLRILEETHEVTATTIYLLHQCVSYAPRLSHFFFHSPLFRRVFKMLEKPLNECRPLREYVADVFSITAAFVSESPAVIAKAMVQLVTDCRDSTIMVQLGKIISGMVTHSPLLLLACDNVGLTDVVLSRLTEVSAVLENESFSESSNEMVNGLTAILVVFANSKFRTLIDSITPETMDLHVLKQKDVFLKESLVLKKDYLALLSANIEPEREDSENGPSTNIALAFPGEEEWLASDDADEDEDEHLFVYGDASDGQNDGDIPRFLRHGQPTQFQEVFGGLRGGHHVSDIFIPGRRVMSHAGLGVRFPIPNQGSRHAFPPLHVTGSRISGRPPIFGYPPPGFREDNDRNGEMHRSHVMPGFGFGIPRPEDQILELIERAATEHDVRIRLHHRNRSRDSE